MHKLLLLLLVSCAACTIEEQGPVRSQIKGEMLTSAPPASSTAPGATLAEIRRQIGTPACSDNAQCRTLAVGARACGGPQAYLPYSTRNTDHNALRALAERSQAESRASVAQDGQMSTCLFEPDPGALCVAGTCQLGSGVPVN